MLRTDWVWRLCIEGVFIEFELEGDSKELNEGEYVARKF